MQQFEHAHDLEVALEAGGDPRALGAAVTVELCGHWDHEPPCRWPHHTDTGSRGGVTVVHVDFACADQEVEVVRSRIDTALERGSLTGPDGTVTRWTVGPTSQAR